MTAVGSFPSLAMLASSEEHSFVVPCKKINEGQDVSTFLVSQAYTDMMTFLMQLNRSMFPTATGSDAQRAAAAVQGMPPNESLFSDTVRRLRSLLQDLEKLIEAHPPDLAPRRFGNMSFRKWCEAVERDAPALLRAHVPVTSLKVHYSSKTAPHDELEAYLLGSFGSGQRLDYGTGHELSFLAFLGCIWKLGGFQIQETEPGLEERNIVLGVIHPYLQLVRKLIETYNLEPAGSHGVWGLDDHSFLPYIFGSAQYGPAISNTDPVPTEGSHPSAPKPADVTKAASVEKLRTKNMYFDAIGFISDVKSGPFWEHSPTLYDISGVRGGWGKINKGMLKMYNAEVLSKFPVIQHLRFGSLFSLERDPNAQAPPSSAHSSSQPKSDETSHANIPAAFPIAANPASSVPPNPEALGVNSTAEPWAIKPPEPLSMTAAPWVQKPAAAPHQMGPVRHPVPGELKSNGALQQIDAWRNPGRHGDTASTEGQQPMFAAESLPPPTSAPWGKKPD